MSRGELWTDSSEIASKKLALARENCFDIVKNNLTKKALKYD
jgi:hypothetical protein